jgi:16S rRNA processing protein RimM
LNDWVPLAEIARPHGVRGEVRLKVYNRDSDLLLEMDEELLRLPDGEEHEVSVDGARRADDAILMKLHSVDDRDRAADLRGAVVCVRRADFPPLEPGEFYVRDVEGARVTVDGQEVGTVTGYREYPTVDVLAVETNDGIYEIPLVDAYVVRVDVEAREVAIAGLCDLEPHKKKP